MTTYLIKIDTEIRGFDSENREWKGFVVDRRAAEH